MVDPVSFGPLRPTGQYSVAAAKGGTVSAKTGIEPEPIAQPVSLSKLAAAARELADAGPPIDYAKIAQIRQAIAGSSYQVDAEAIADAVLRHYGNGRL